MTVSWSDWQSYPWKNELSVQIERVRIHSDEIITEALNASHNPYHMLERALVLSAFCIRRMIEKRLLTDSFSETQIEVRMLRAVSDGSFRMPFHYSAGFAAGGLGRNYRMVEPESLSLKPKGLADEIIHSSQLMLIHGEKIVPDGLLIASDWHLSKRLIHLTVDEYEKFVRSVLDDFVRLASDQWDPETESVTSIRK